MCFQKELKCPYEGCEEAFKRRDRLRTHISSKHTYFYRFKCTYEGCSDVFAGRHYLQRHLLRHERAASQSSTLPSPQSPAFVKLPRFKKCPSCSEQFLRKTQLRLHRFEAHAEPLPFVCSVCSKGFPVKYALDRHAKYHNNTQRYPCEFPDCGFTTCKWMEFRKHLATTHKAKLQCTFCGKQFKQNSSLLIHLDAKHSNSQNHFTCDIEGCTKSYSRESSLRAHQRAGHGEAKFCCSLCGKEFRYKHVMTRHEAKCVPLPNPKPPKVEKVKKKKKQEVIAEKKKKKAVVVVEKLTKPKPKRKVGNNKRTTAIALIKEVDFDASDRAALEQADRLQEETLTAKPINGVAA